MTRNAIPTLEDVVNNAVGSLPENTLGYGNPGVDDIFGSNGSGYIATMKLSIDKVSTANLDEGTENIVSYDKCESADAYIGQINMGTASSFCGINGALWGYHLVKVKESDLYAHLLFTVGKEKIKVYSAEPLLAATERLFGHVDEEYRRHRPLPGAHVICANKDMTVRGPAYAWACLAIAITDDRTKNANLFIEDCGVFPAIEPDTDHPNPVPDKEQVTQQLIKHQKNVGESILQCARDYKNVTYKEIFIASKAIYAGADEVACALACAPYVLLAQNTVPDKEKPAKPAQLINMPLPDWDDKVFPNQKDFPATPLEPNGTFVNAPPSGS
ncbi:MAG: histidine decarboxylase, pyruvoyl type [Pseudonocardiaceae bacterium]